MSCTYTCDACGNTAAAVYRFGRWQHPEGWWTRAYVSGGENAGLTACTRACIDVIEHRLMDERSQAQIQAETNATPAKKRTTPKKSPAAKPAAKQPAAKKTGEPASKPAAKKTAGETAAKTTKRVASKKTATRKAA